MRRGDVVRTTAEFMALPVGSEALSIDGDVIQRHIHQEGTGIQEAWLPALARVVGPVEPEYLMAATQAMHRVQCERPSEHTLDDEQYSRWNRDMARAAVAAADKARGIVNTREEFDALPTGTQVLGWFNGMSCYFYQGEAGAMVPDAWPAIVKP